MALFDTFAADARRRKQADDEDYMQAQEREWAADDTRRASLATLKSVNSSGYPLISAGALAPSSGYAGARDYYQGLDDQQTIAKHNGGSVRFGGTVASRPSLSALRGSDDPNDFAARNRGNLETIAPTAEQQRQGRILNDMDTRTEAGIRRDEEGNDRAFDIMGGRFDREANVVGDTKREQALADARAGSEIYFDPAVKSQRDDQFYQQMEQLRRRYTDPTIAKGINDANVAMIRGQYGLGRQDLTNQGNLAVAGSRADASRDVAGVNANSRVAASAAGAGANPANYANRSFEAPDDMGGKTMTRAEFNAWAAQSGLSPQDAAGVARQAGYTIR